MDITFLILIYVVCFIVGVFITRWVFRIDTIVAQQKKLYTLMREIAEKTGVDEQIILRLDDPAEYDRMKALKEYRAIRNKEAEEK